MKPLSIVLLFISINSFAQDVITKIDSSKTTAVIIEINPTVIKYKLFNYSDGPTITVSKSEVAYIKYKNGIIEKIISKENPQPKVYNYYNKPSATYVSPEEKEAKVESLYKYKNSVGLNYIALLNNCIGINYMRDVKQANLIINVPIMFGFDKPTITNGLYKDRYVGPHDGFTYNKLDYQFGLSMLFTPSMKYSSNFLIGPSFHYTSFDVSTELNYSYQTTVNNQTQTNSEMFKNDFKLNRKHYGLNIGFMSRFSEHFGMTLLLTVGYKEDSYNEKDPYGVEFIKSKNGYYRNTTNFFDTNGSLYSNLMWTINYRF